MVPNAPAGKERMSTRAGYAGASERPGAARETPRAPPRLAHRPRGTPAAQCAPAPPRRAHRPPEEFDRAHKQAAPCRLPSATCSASWSAAPSWPGSAAATWASSPRSSPCSSVVGAAAHHRRVQRQRTTSGRGGPTRSPPATPRPRPPTPTARSTAPLRRTTSGNPNLKDVGTPPNPEATPTKGTATLLMSTNQGDLPSRWTGRRHRARWRASPTWPAEVLRQQPCHREVNQPTFGVLQCGDPTGTGSGRPDLQVRPGDPRRDDLPARHHRDGQQPASRTRPAASSSSASPTPSSARTTRRRAPSTGRAGRAGQDRRGRQRRLVRPSAGGGAPELAGDDHLDDRRRLKRTRCPRRGSRDLRQGPQGLRR